MEIDKVLSKLTEELTIEVHNRNYDAIRIYLQYALVIGLEQPIVTYSKTILMLDENNNLIKTFDRLIDAAAFVKDYKKLKTKKQTISIEIWRTLNNKKNTSYGYHWKYK